MHSLDFVRQRGRAERVRVLGSFVDVAEGHLLGELLLAFGHKLVMCFSATGKGRPTRYVARGLAQPTKFPLGGGACMLFRFFSSTIFNMMLAVWRFVVGCF